jgi:hypothetical protein
MMQLADEPYAFGMVREVELDQESTRIAGGHDGVVPNIELRDFLSL